MYVIPVYRFDRDERRPNRTRQVLGTTAALAGTAAAGVATFRNRGSISRAARIGMVGLKRAGRSASIRSQQARNAVIGRKAIPGYGMTGRNGSLTRGQRVRMERQAKRIKPY